MNDKKTLIHQQIETTLEQNYMPYAMSVILSRALPEIDGLKPAHRKLLYTMYKMNLLKSQKTKSANVVGQTMKLNPHGDSAIYATLVRMATSNESLLYPYVDSKGNFGKVYSKDMQYAASRYTEVKLAKICKYMFLDIDKDTVDFEENYDSTTYEPTLLPVSFPSILVNPNQGIAVGMASNICSFNLKDIANATIALMKDEDASLFRHIKGPDFPTGAIVLKDKDALNKIYETGLGSFYMESVWSYDSKNRCIEITEIPYTTTIEAIIERVVKGMKSNEFKQINDIRDESDLRGLKITIDIKKGTDPEQLMKLLHKKTTLRDSFHCNFNLIINGYPRTIGVRQILLHWIDFRISSLRRKFRYEINTKKREMHLLDALSKVLLDIDRAIELIRNTKSDSEVVPALEREFDLDQEQAEYVANIKLRNINKEYILSKIDRQKTLKEEIKYLKELYEDDSKIKSVIEKELLDIVKDIDPKRKSKLEDYQDIEELETLNEDDLKEYTYLITKHNYIKKLNDNEINKQQRLKDDDEISFDFKSDSKAEILLFTNKANCYKVYVSDLNENKASELGQYLPSLVSIEEDEEVILVRHARDYKQSLFVVFDDGKVSKIGLDNFITKTKRQKIINAFSSHTKVLLVEVVDDLKYIYLERKSQKFDSAMAFSLAQIPSNKTRNSTGTRLFIMPPNSKISKAKILDSVVKVAAYLVDKIPSSGKRK